MEWSLLQRTRYNALSLGRKTPKIAPSPCDFVTLAEEDRATAIGSMLRKLVKVAHVVPEISWQTDGHTDTHMDVLITILHHHSRGRSNNSIDYILWVKNRCRGWVSQPTSIYPVCFLVGLCVCACIAAWACVCLYRCALGPLSHRTRIQTFRAKFIAPACRFSVNVVALTDMRVSQILIENFVEYARFAVSLKLQSDDIRSCPDVWTSGRFVLLFWADWFRATSGRDHFRSRSLEWSAVHGELTQLLKALSTRPVARSPRGTSMSPLSCRRQPFYDAVVGELGAAAVVASRTHRSPSAVPRRRHRWTRCRRPWTSRGCTDVEAESTTALTPGSIANRCAPDAAVCASAVRSCCRVCVVSFFFTFSCPGTLFSVITDSYYWDNTQNCCCLVLHCFCCVILIRDCYYYHYTLDRALLFDTHTLYTDFCH